MAAPAARDVAGSNRLGEEFFGLFDTLTDRYGIAWMFQVGGDPNA